MTYKYSVRIDVTKTLCGTYKPYNVTFTSDVLLSDRDIRKEAINRVPKEYISFGQMYKSVTEV